MPTCREKAILRIDSGGGAFRGRTTDIDGINQYSRERHLRNAQSELQQVVERHPRVTGRRSTAAVDTDAERDFLTPRLPCDVVGRLSPWLVADTAGSAVTPRVRGRLGLA
jgi:hypothetical protein